MYAGAASYSTGTRRLKGAVGQMRDEGMIENTSSRRMNRFRLLSAIEAASERAKLMREQDRLEGRTPIPHQASLFSVGGHGSHHGSFHGSHNGSHRSLNSMGSPMAGQFASVRSSEARRSSAEGAMTMSLWGGRLGTLKDQRHLSKSEQAWNFFSDPASSRPAWVFGILVFALIIISCVSFIVESIPDFCCGRYDSLLVPIETVCIAFFTLEYIGRISTVPWFWPEDKETAEAEQQEAQESVRMEAERKERVQQIGRAHV